MQIKVFIWVQRLISLWQHSLLIVWFNFNYMVIFVDGTKPLSCIDGTDDVHDINSEEDISTFLETGTLLYPLPDILVNRACVSFLQLCLDTVLAYID
jgi:hypothetical protein